MSAKAVTSDVLRIWNNSGINCFRLDKICDKVKRLYEEYQKVKSHKDRRTQNQISLECDFKRKIRKLFDIAHSKLNSTDTIKTLLEDQRTHRIMKIKSFNGISSIMDERRSHKKIVDTFDDVDYDEVSLSDSSSDEEIFYIDQPV